VTAETTIISIRVRVPVLSEQMRETEPRVSTAGRRRMMALRFAMRCTPIARVMVMMRRQPFRNHRHRDAGHRLEHIDELHARITQRAKANTDADDRWPPAVIR
jgi:hypothetical protein